MKKICVFCGSSKGIKAIYSEKAELLADMLVDNNIELVYGGSNIGLMQVLADRVLLRGGKVIGVMPANLAANEIMHENMTETILAKDMQERKKTMEKLSDGFITMPGGIGSLDELFEMLCWNQLSLIHKPVAIYNVDHFYDPLIEWLDNAVDMKFIRQEHRANILISDDPAILLEGMRNYKGQIAEKWVDRLKDKGY